MTKRFKDVSLIFFFVLVKTFFLVIANKYLANNTRSAL